MIHGTLSPTTGKMEGELAKMRERLCSLQKQFQEQHARATPWRQAQAAARTGAAAASGQGSELRGGSGLNPGKATAAAEGKVVGSQARGVQLMPDGGAAAPEASSVTPQLICGAPAGGGGGAADVHSTLAQVNQAAGGGADAGAALSSAALTPMGPLAAGWVAPATPLTLTPPGIAMGVYPEADAAAGHVQGTHLHHNGLFNADGTAVTKAAACAVQPPSPLVPAALDFGSAGAHSSGPTSTAAPRAPTAGVPSAAVAVAAPAAVAPASKPDEAIAAGLAAGAGAVCVLQPQGAPATGGGAGKPPAARKSGSGSGTTKPGAAPAADPTAKRAAAAGSSMQKAPATQPPPPPASPPKGPTTTDGGSAASNQGSSPGLLKKLKISLPAFTRSKGSGASSRYGSISEVTAAMAAASSNEATPPGSATAAAAEAASKQQVQCSPAQHSPVAGPAGAEACVAVAADQVHPAAIPTASGASSITVASMGTGTTTVAANTTTECTSRPAPAGAAASAGGAGSSSTGGVVARVALDPLAIASPEDVDLRFSLSSHTSWLPLSPGPLLGAQARPPLFRAASTSQPGAGSGSGARLAAGSEGGGQSPKAAAATAAQPASGARSSTTGAQVVAAPGIQPQQRVAVAGSPTRAAPAGGGAALPRPAAEYERLLAALSSMVGEVEVHAHELACAVPAAGARPASPSRAAVPAQTMLARFEHAVADAAARLSRLCPGGPQQVVGAHSFSGASSLASTPRKMSEAGQGVVPMVRPPVVPSPLGQSFAAPSCGSSFSEQQQQGQGVQQGQAGGQQSVGRHGRSPSNASIAEEMLAGGLEDALAVSGWIQLFYDCHVSCALQAAGLHNSAGRPGHGSKLHCLNVPCRRFPVYETSAHSSPCFPLCQPPPPARSCSVC